jgi:hypothetical protein
MWLFYIKAVIWLIDEDEIGVSCYTILKRTATIKLSFNFASMIDRKTSFDESWYDVKYVRNKWRLTLDGIGDIFSLIEIWLIVC